MLWLFQCYDYSDVMIIPMLCSAETRLWSIVKPDSSEETVAKISITKLKREREVKHSGKKVDLLVVCYEWLFFHGFSLQSGFSSESIWMDL